MKCQMYSLITVLIIIPLLLFITYYLIVSQNITQGAVNERIVSDQLHQLEKSLEKDFERALDISGKRALLASVDWVITNGSGLDDAELRVKELMENGTIYSSTTFFMQDNTIRDWIDRILSLETAFNVTISYSNLTIKNFDGFNLRAAANINITVSDSIGIASITKSNLEKTVFISVEGFEDPVFPLNTGGFIRRFIEKSPSDYSAMILANGTTSLGKCSGNVTFNEFLPDTDKILVTDNASGISGFMGVVAETVDLPSVSCYVLGVPNAVTMLNNSINQTNCRMIYLDNTTFYPFAVWHLPVNEDLENGYYRSGNGPDFLTRLEGNLSTSINGIETFISIPILQQAGLPVYNYSRIDYMYFSEDGTAVFNVKGLPDWFMIDYTNAEKYNLTDLLV